MIRIDSPDLDAGLELLEGVPDPACNPWGAGDFGLDAARAAYADAVRENVVLAGRSWRARWPQITIYGWGGFSRYFVRADGRVEFSHHHGTRTQDAADLGFDICR